MPSFSCERNRTSSPGSNRYWTSSLRKSGTHRNPIAYRADLADRSEDAGRAKGPATPKSACPKSDASSHDEGTAFCFLRSPPRSLYPFPRPLSPPYNLLHVCPRTIPEALAPPPHPLHHH